MLGLFSCGEKPAPKLEDAKIERTVKPVVLLNLAGDDVQVPDFSKSNCQVIVFSRVDCPISNRYAMEVRRIVAEYAPKGIGFHMVYVDPDETPELINKHRQEYGYDFSALRDTKHRLVKLTKATVTPEVVVFCCDEGMVYRGRIDDQYVDFGKQRRQPNKRDLRDVLSSIVAGTIPAFSSTKAIGCYIEELE